MCILVCVLCDDAPESTSTYDEASSSDLPIIRNWTNAGPPILRRPPSPCRARAVNASQLNHPCYGFALPPPPPSGGRRIGPRRKF